MSHRSRATRIHAWWWYSAREMLRNDSRPAAARLTPDAIVPPADLVTLSRDRQIEMLSDAYARAVGER